MDSIFNYLGASNGSLVLDAGCGSGVEAIRLARRGLRCLAVDFSEEVLERAKLNIHEEQLERQIAVEYQDITAMSLADESVDYVLCWTVLMHVPDVKKAVKELCRVLKSGGRIVIVENNMYSIDGIVKRIIRRIKSNRPVRQTAFGIEYFIETLSGPILHRVGDIGCISEILNKNGVVVEKHFAGNSTDVYSKLPWPVLIKLVGLWNEFWLRFIHLPGLAYANILIGRKLEL